MGRKTTKAAVIVAHPDDEVIWCGGFIAASSDFDWTVLSLCRSDDPDRYPKFKAVCEILGAHGIICDLDDSPELLPVDVKMELGGRILEALGGTSWNLCITHGHNGEYGHLRHKQIHDEVTRLVSAGLLACRRLWTFAYECDAQQGRCEPAEWGNKLITLSESRLAAKKVILQDVYGYDSGSFEAKACISPESFLVMRSDPLGREQ
jgi:LmbE family N-acetylglucosaminyl deacetylase